MIYRSDQLLIPGTEEDAFSYFSLLHKFIISHSWDIKFIQKKREIIKRESMFSNQGEATDHRHGKVNAIGLFWNRRVAGLINGTGPVPENSIRFKCKTEEQKDQKACTIFLKSRSPLRPTEALRLRSAAQYDYRLPLHSGPNLLLRPAATAVRVSCPPHSSGTHAACPVWALDICMNYALSYWYGIAQTVALA